MVNILFISNGEGVDYQCDCVFHGLNSIEGINVYILNDYQHMFDNNSIDFLSRQYGMGFTITNRVSINKRRIHTLDEATENIRMKFYDVIIFGSIERCNLLLDIVLLYYSKNRIIFIDGEDEDFSVKIIHRMKGRIKAPIFYEKYKKRAADLSKKGIYFKRELRVKERKTFFPISFAIPSQNVIEAVPEKSILLAKIIPGKLDTYIYNKEEDYYNGYKRAWFGMTIKKAGWDCMRHYEILANGCIPYFPDLDDCPFTTMHTFPKNIIIETNRLYEENRISENLASYYAEFLLGYTREYLTTERLAQYILSFI